MLVFDSFFPQTHMASYSTTSVYYQSGQNLPHTGHPTITHVEAVSLHMISSPFRREAFAIESVREIFLAVSFILNTSNDTMLNPVGGLCAFSVVYPIEKES